MKIKVYRGTNEIGGTCVELKAENGKILWVDLGSPLEEKNPNTNYTNNKVDALLISHPHQDHFGLMETVGVEVPVYVGELSLDLINATRLFRGMSDVPGNFKFINPWKSFTIQDTFHVTPYLTDHSTPEAFAFLIEADGKRVFYSGDFRATGRKGQVFQSIIERPPKNIDLLLVEGTMVGRANHKYETEDSIEQAFYEKIRGQANVSFVISSAQNLDRLISVFRACKRTQKQLVLDVYSAWILDLARKKSEKVPAMEWEGIKIYDHPGQLLKLNDSRYDEFKARIEAQRIGNDVFKKPSDYVYFVRCPNTALINKLKQHGTINILYSQWQGYLLEEYKTYCTDIVKDLIAQPYISFEHIHTSGHATVEDLVKFTKAMNSSQVAPIHTAHPAKLKLEFEAEGLRNINLWEDGKEYTL